MGGSHWQQLFVDTHFEDIESILYTEHGWFVGASKSKLYHFDSDFKRLGNVPIKPKRSTWAGFGFVIDLNEQILAINENDAIYTSKDGVNWKIVLEDPTIRPRMAYKLDSGVVLTSFTSMKYFKNGHYSSLTCPLLRNLDSGRIEGCGYNIHVGPTQIYASKNLLMIIND